MSKPQFDNLSIKEIFRQSDFSGKTVLILSTWFGSGLLPIAPGTFGTVAALPLIVVSAYLAPIYKILALGIITVVAIWSSGRCQELLGQGDPAEVVIDEVAGFLLAMLFLPFSCLTLILGFILFRFFDILKPYPINRLERLRGGFGIVMDDLLAGLYAYLGVRIILLFTG